MKPRWNRRYRIRSYLRSALWVIPFVAVVIEQFGAKALDAVDAQVTWRALDLELSGAVAIYNTVISLTLSFIVFTFSSLLVAIQVASGQYTPRIIATTLLRDNVIRYTVGFFVFTFVIAIRTLGHTETTVHQFKALVIGLFGLLCIAAFLYLIDHAARMLRPVSLVRRVAEDGLKVIESVYPELYLTSDGAPNSVTPPGTPPTTTVPHQETSAIVLAINIDALVKEAMNDDIVIECLPQVGDFVGRHEPLFLLHGVANKVDEDALRANVAFGSERTMEQDPLFALRVLVDIAIKALSKAINDPTTAVLALDQLQRLLFSAGKRRLKSEEFRDAEGDVRVIFHTPNWGDFVHLAFCEIRFYGAENLQVARRLRAMLILLMETLPPSRKVVLRQELALLDRTIDRLYVFPEDLALARIPDSQGLGASSTLSVHAYS